MRAVLILMVAGGLVLAGCSKPKKPAPPKATSTPPAVKKDVNKGKSAPVKTTKQPPKKTPSKVTAPKKPPVLTKERLEAAYVEIFCAKKKGNAAEVFKIFKKYGFSEPKHWTKIWKAATKDEVWVAKLHQRAINACKGAAPPAP